MVVFHMFLSVFLNIVLTPVVLLVLLIASRLYWRRTRRCVPACLAAACALMLLDHALALFFVPEPVNWPSGVAVS